MYTYMYGLAFLFIFCFFQVVEVTESATYSSSAVDADYVFAQVGGALPPLPSPSLFVSSV